MAMMVAGLHAPVWTRVQKSWDEETGLSATCVGAKPVAAKHEKMWESRNLKLRIAPFALRIGACGDYGSL
jgi:hypothetical protein